MVIMLFECCVLCEMFKVKLDVFIITCMIQQFIENGVAGRNGTMYPNSPLHVVLNVVSKPTRYLRITEFYLLIGTIFRS